MTVPCTDPVRNSTFDPAVCAMCTEPIADHDPAVLPTYAPAEVAMWRWFVANGGIWDLFGGFDPHRSRTAAVRGHLDRCAVDGDASVAPVARSADAFVDTISPTTPVELTSGAITCECGTICDQE